MLSAKKWATDALNALSRAADTEGPHGVRRLALERGDFHWIAEQRQWGRYHMLRAALPLLDEENMRHYRGGLTLDLEGARTFRDRCAAELGALEESEVDHLFDPAQHPNALLLIKWVEWRADVGCDQETSKVGPMHLEDFLKERREAAEVRERNEKTEEAERPTPGGVGGVPPPPPKAEPPAAHVYPKAEVKAPPAMAAPDRKRAAQAQGALNPAEAKASRKGQSEGAIFGARIPTGEQSSVIAALSLDEPPARGPQGSAGGKHVKYNSEQIMERQQKKHRKKKHR